MKYPLKSKNIEVGVIEGTDENFLNLWGSFRISKDITDKPLLTFIDVSMRENDLLDQDHIRDTSSEFAELDREMKPFYSFFIL